MIKVTVHLNPQNEEKGKKTSLGRIESRKPKFFKSEQNINVTRDG